MKDIQEYNKRQIEALGKSLNQFTAIEYAKILRCEICGVFLNTADILKSYKTKLRCKEDYYG